MAQDLREQACWLTLVFESGLTTRVINDILVVWCYQRKQNLQAFFAADPRSGLRCAISNRMCCKSLSGAREVGGAGISCGAIDECLDLSPDYF